MFLATEGMRGGLAPALGRNLSLSLSFEHDLSLKTLGSSEGRVADLQGWGGGWNIPISKS